MKIVQKTSFRSNNISVNKTDDMYRVVVDMKRVEYPKFVDFVDGVCQGCGRIYYNCLCGHED